MFSKEMHDLLYNEYQKFKQTKEYSYRKKQLAFVSLASEIIKETLEGNLTCKKLTGLIQLLKFSNKKNKQIAQNYKDNFNNNKDLLEKWLTSPEPGFTGAGKASIDGLNKKQLLTIRTFLSDIIGSDNKEELINLLNNFLMENIPFVTPGIFSPWIYYLKPTIFPIYNSMIRDLCISLGAKNYLDAVNLYSEISDIIDEKDLGLLDAFFSFYFKFIELKGMQNTTDINIIFLKIKNEIINKREMEIVDITKLLEKYCLEYNIKFTASIIMEFDKFLNVQGE